VRPAVDGVKMVSGIYSYHTTVDPTVQSNATSLKNFLCDLDWSQPDPYSDIGTLFSANQDFCATDVKFVFVQAISLENATSAILQNSTLLNNKYSNIVAACSQPATAAPHYYYCLFAFVDLEEVSPFVPSPFPPKNTEAECGCCGDGGNRYWSPTARGAAHPTPVRAVNPHHDVKGRAKEYHH